MTSAFDFYMPQIDLSAICKTHTYDMSITKSNIRNTKNSRKTRQANRRNDYIIKKWRESYTYKLLMYGIQNVNQYNAMCAKALVQFEVLKNHIEMESHIKLITHNMNKFYGMNQEIANMIDYINQLKSELYKIVYTSTNLFREHKTEVLTFVNTPLDKFAY